MSGPTLYERLGGRVTLERVVTSFYQRAQADPLLGPVFAHEVAEWPAHIETVTHFWSTQTGGPPLYRGGMGKHLRLGLRPEHFSRWLELWLENATQEVGPELAQELTAIGQAFAARLQNMGQPMMIGRPGPG